MIGRNLALAYHASAHSRRHADTLTILETTKNSRNEVIYRIQTALVRIGTWAFYAQFIMTSAAPLSHSLARYIVPRNMRLSLVNACFRCGGYLRTQFKFDGLEVIRISHIRFDSSSIKLIIGIFLRHDSDKLFVHIAVSREENEQNASCCKRRYRFGLHELISNPLLLPP